MKNNDKQIVSLDPILNRKFPCFLDIEKAAQKRMPRFIREYISGGIGQDLGVTRNRTELDNVLLTPRYLVETDDVNIECEILGQQYDAPFGVSPVGFGDLAWPKSAQLLPPLRKPTTFLSVLRFLHCAIWRRFGNMQAARRGFSSIIPKTPR